MGSAEGREPEGVPQIPFPPLSALERAREGWSKEFFSALLGANSRTSGGSGHGCAYGDGDRALTGQDGSGRQTRLRWGQAPVPNLALGNRVGTAPYAQRTEGNL